MSIATLTASGGTGGPYTWTKVGGADATKFNLSGSGVLSFVAPPDFDVPTDADANNVYEVQVRVSDGVSNVTQMISVAVTNVLEKTLNALILSASTIAENSVAGTVVGAVLGATAGSNLTLTGNAGGRLALSGMNIVAGAMATNYETATSLSITLRETIADATNSPRDTVLTVNVTNVLEKTLNALILSPSTIAEESAAGTVVGAVLGATAGSNLTLIGNAGGRFALSGMIIVAGATATDYETATRHSITLRETIADATNSPRDTVLFITVTNVVEVFTFRPYAYYDETSVVQAAGAVSQWSDKGPNGINLVQAAGTNQPAYQASGYPGGLPCLRFDGTNDFLMSAALNLSSKTVMAAFLSFCDDDITGDYKGVVIISNEPTGPDYGSPAAMLIYRDVSYLCGVARDGAGALVGVADAVVSTFGTVCGNGTLEVYNHTDGTQDTDTGGGGAYPTSARIVLGARRSNQTMESWYNFRVRRLVLLDFAPNASQRDEIWTWLSPSTSPFSFRPLAYYDETSVVQAGGAVSQWTDKGANGLHFTQATGAAQPSYQTTGLSGGPCLSFDGTDDYLKGPAHDFSAASAMCMFARIEIDAAETYGGILSLSTDAGNDYQDDGCMALVIDGANVVSAHRGSPCGVSAAFGADLSVGSTQVTATGNANVYNHTALTTNANPTASFGPLASNGYFILGTTWNTVHGKPGVCGKFKMKRLVLLDFVPNVAQRDEIWAWLAEAAADVPWTPADLGTDLVGWYDAQDTATITQAAGAVSQWSNKSTASDRIANATQPTGSAQPSYNATAFGSGKPGIYFNGIPVGLMLGSLSSRTWVAAEVFYVMKRVADPPGVGDLSGSFFTTQFTTEAGLAPSSCEPFADSQLYIGTFTSGRHDAIGDPVQSYTTPRVIGIRSAPSDFQYWIDGAVFYATTAHAFALPHTVTMATGNNNTYYQGWGAELVVCKRALTTDERQKVEGYLAHKWGIAGNLPADHPYKSLPPGLGMSALLVNGQDLLAYGDRLVISDV